MPGVVCDRCGKQLEGEPNFCPACGADLRGLSPTADTASGPMAGRIIDARYKVLEKLGEGGMGSVYKVEHVRMGKVLALKVLRPDSAREKQLKKRFSQEARALAKLSSPNTVQVFDHGELADGSLYIAMEYLPGKDLAWHLRAHGAMSEEHTLSIGIALLSSLAEAHGLGIVHRDLKPANVMLVKRGGVGAEQVKLLDFGIAKVLEASESKKSITGVTDFVGTPAYMSPEQARGDELDARSDLYSLAAMLFELVTGRELFDGPTPMSVVTKHMLTPPPTVSQVAPQLKVSKSFERALLKALQKQPAERFANADEMRAALERVRRELGAAQHITEPSPADEPSPLVANRRDFDRFERSLRLRRALAPLGAAGVLLVAAGIAVAVVYSLSGAADVEREPNDDPNQATPIALGRPVSGSMGPAAEGESDRDVYVLTVPEGPLRVTVSGVVDLNLVVELLQLEPAADGQKLVRRLVLDDEGLGRPERVDAFFARAGPLYVRVEERAHFTEALRNPREKALVPYTLLVEPIDTPGALEEEPNDTPSTAQSVPRSVSLLAFTGARVDWPDRIDEPKAGLSSRDTFQVEVASESEKVAVLVVPPKQGKLVVVDAVALEVWLHKREVGGPAARASPPPTALVLDGKPGLLQLSAAGGKRRVRVQCADECVAGTEYHLAFLTPAANGLASAVDLAQKLESQGRLAERRAALELAANEFASAELKAMVGR